MTVRLIEVIADPARAERLAEIAETHHALDFRAGAPGPDGAQAFRILAHPEGQQDLIDALQGSLAEGPGWRIAIIPVDATIPEPVESPEASHTSEEMLREKLYDQIARGAHVDATFLLLIGLSTLVAAIGLLYGDVAVIIAAMVIAPLLGPNVALAFASAIGDRRLLGRAAIASALGIGLSVAGASLIGFVLPGRHEDPEFLNRTLVGYHSVALALASGTAGALSLLTNVSSTLVGVMVAVALMPPAVVLGYMLGSAQLPQAAGAGALLAPNIVCINLSAQLVFFFRGIRPRTWLERREAQQSTAISIAVWSGLLMVLLAIIYFLRA
jgi:uncharacterized hydrophobic protein (TIGR00341 family)